VAGITRLKLALRAISQELMSSPAPVWVADFPLFMQVLVREVELNSVEKTGFFRWTNSELALSRCLSGDDSLFEKLEALQQVSKKRLTAGIKKTIDEFLTEKGCDFDKHDHRLGQFVLFRALFDILYTRRTDLWTASNPSMIEKVVRLSQMPSSYFRLHGEYVARESTEDETIEQFIRGEPGLAKAAASLSLSAFATNPFDCLYHVYIALTELRTAAIDTYESKTGTAGPPELTLSFDDTFSLFFAVFLASDLTDVSSLTTFVLEFVPRPLSSTFEYSRMMLEALDIHVRGVDIDLLAQGG
jgi:hypothetical protein